MAPPLEDIFDASFLAQRALKLDTNAYKAALLCDAEATHRLIAEIRRLSAAARALIAGAPAAARAFYGTDDVTLRILDRIEAGIPRILSLLDHCPNDPRNPYIDGGTFAETEGEIPGQSGNNRIEFVFELNGQVPCEQLCLVAVFHIEEDETGRILERPSEGYADGYDPPSGAPRDDDAVNGYVVDTWLMRPASETDFTFVPNHSPCIPTMESDGNRITGSDSPLFLKRGYTAYFEMCVVCLDNDDWTVLGCMRWVNRKGEPDTSRILPNPDGETDWGDASENFNDALRRWLSNHGE